MSALARQAVGADPHATRQMLRYLEGIVKFRLTIDHNVYDAAYGGRGDRDAEDKGQIVYVYDANAVMMVFEPTRRPELVHPFAAGRQAIDDGNQAIARATATITAEYLFSRKLPHQKDFPVYIDPDHAVELQNILQNNRHELQKRFEQGKHALGEGERGLREALSGLEQQVREAREKEPEALIDLFADKLPALIDTYHLHDVVAIAQLDKLRRQRLLRPLAAAPFVDPALMRPDPALVNAWRERLAEFDDSQRTANLERDAHALARLEALNTHCESNEIPARFVLVTEDNKMHAALAERLRDIRGVGSLHKRRRASNLRQIKQYIPLINAADMPNFSQPGGGGDMAAVSAVTGEIKEVIDGLFAFGEMHDLERRPNFLQMLGLVISKMLQQERRLRADATASGTARDLSGFDQRLQSSWSIVVKEQFGRLLCGDVLREAEQLRAIWTGMIRTAVGYNVELLTQHYQTLMTELRDVVQELLEDATTAQQINRAYDASQRRLLERIDRRHAQWAAHALLAEARRRVDEPGRSRPWRPMALRLDGLTPRVRNLDGLRLIERVSAPEMSLAEGDLCDELLDALGERERTTTLQMLMTTAALAFILDEWGVAADYAERAEQAARHDTQARAEALFLHAAASRRDTIAALLRDDATPDPSEARATMQNLVERLDDLRRAAEQDDPLAEARATVERSAVMLAQCLLARSVATLGGLVEGSNLALDLRRATTHLMRVLAMIDAIEAHAVDPDGWQRGSAIVTALHRQAVSLLSAIEIATRTGLLPGPVKLLDTVARFIEESPPEVTAGEHAPSARWHHERRLAACYAAQAKSPDLSAPIEEIRRRLETDDPQIEALDRLLLHGYSQAALPA